MDILGESIHPVPSAWIEDHSQPRERFGKTYINNVKISVGPVPYIGMILKLIDSDDRLNQVIIKTIQAALDMHEGNQTQAAKYLGVSVGLVHSFVHGKSVFNFCGTNGKWRKKIGGNRAEKARSKDFKP